MLSKGSAAVLPALLLGIIWWLRSLTKNDLLRIAPFFLLAVVLTVVNIWFQTHGEHVEIRNAGFAERLLGAGGVPWFSLYKALLPIDLVFIYPPWQIEVGDPLWWLPLLAAIIVTAALWRYKKGWSRPLLFAWGFFCVSLVPVLGFADVGFMKYSLVADHYQHIAVIGVITLAAAGWSLWHQRARKRANWVTTAVAITAMGALAFLTWRQSMLYGDKIMLYQCTLQKNPDCSVAHSNLAFALADAGRLQDAVEHFRQALRLRPDYADAHNNLGGALAQAGRQEEAIKCYEQALALKPDFPEAQYNLGLILLQTGRPREAIKYFEQSIRLKPDYFVSHNNLGNAFFQTGRLPEAIEHFRQALRLKPDYASAHNNLGVALVDAGRLQEAIEHYQQALRFNHDFTDAYYGLALAYAKMQQSSQAIAAAQKGLEIARSRDRGYRPKRLKIG